MSLVQQNILTHVLGVLLHVPGLRIRHQGQDLVGFALVQDLLLALHLGHLLLLLLSYLFLGCGVGSGRGGVVGELGLDQLDEHALGAPLHVVGLALVAQGHCGLDVEDHVLVQDAVVVFIGLVDDFEEGGVLLGGAQ